MNTQIEQPHCAECGYTKQDALIHWDHWRCKGSIPGYETTKAVQKPHCTGNSKAADRIASTATVGAETAPSTTSSARREISVAEDDDLLELIQAALDNVTDYDTSTGEYAKAALDSLRPYLRTTVPVSIDPCAQAVSHILNKGHVFPAHKYIAKAVLDAAGVKYVD